MSWYLAPMEGVTTYVFRNAYHSHYRPMDKYFLPFIVPHIKRDFNAREYRDLLPEHNQGMYAVPQILTCNGEDFVRTARAMADMGYREINWNLGCPSKTVVSRKRGSGFLAYPDELDACLEYIFSHLDLEISVKTRIGRDTPEEFEHLLPVYNRYPLKELIIHPRVQKDFYKNRPNWDVFAQGMAESKNPVCYNGDVFRAADYWRLKQRFPQVQTVMLGRGIIGNPGLVEQIEAMGPAARQPESLALGQSKSQSGSRPELSDRERARLKSFLAQLRQDYLLEIPEENNVLFKFKEIWCYLADLFPENVKAGKKIKKARTLAEYQLAEQQILEL